MNHDDSQRGNSNRKPMSQNFNGRGGNYSPSASYNYSPGSGSHQQPSHHSHHPRRRSDRFKRESINYTDRIAKQNDVIIRLLKEIRDRLPPLDSRQDQASERGQGPQGEHAYQEQDFPADLQEDSAEDSE